MNRSRMPLDDASSTSAVLPPASAEARRRARPARDRCCPCAGPTRMSASSIGTPTARPRHARRSSLCEGSSRLVQHRRKPADEAVSRPAATRRERSGCREAGLRTPGADAFSFRLYAARTNRGARARAGRAPGEIRRRTIANHDAGGYRQGDEAGGADRDLTDLQLLLEAPPTRRPLERALGRPGARGRAGARAP